MFYSGSLQLSKDQISGVFKEFSRSIERVFQGSHFGQNLFIWGLKSLYNCRLWRKFFYYSLECNVQGFYSPNGDGDFVRIFPNFKDFPEELLVFEDLEGEVKFQDWGPNSKNFPGLLEFQKSVGTLFTSILFSFMYTWWRKMSLYIMKVKRQYNYTKNMTAVNDITILEVKVTFQCVKCMYVWPQKCGKWVVCSMIFHCFLLEFRVMILYLQNYYHETHFFFIYVMRG